MIKQSQSKLGEVLFRRIGVESVNNQLVLLYPDSMYFFSRVLSFRFSPVIRFSVADENAILLPETARDTKRKIASRLVFSRHAFATSS